MPESSVSMVDVLMRRRDGVLDRAIWYLTILLLATVIFSTAAVQTAAILLIVAWILQMIVTRKLLVKRTPLDYPFLAFILARILAIPLSIDPGVSAQAFRTEIVFYPLYFAFTGTLKTDRPEEIRFLTRLILGAAVVASLIGIAKYFLGFGERASSTTGGYYAFGLYLCIVFPIALAAGRGVLSNTLQWALVCAAIVLGIVFSFDRVHWAGMAIAVVVLGVVRDRRLLAVFIIGVILIVLLSPAVSQRFMEMVTIGSHASDRDVLWRGGIMIAGDHPFFGFGLRTFSLIFPLTTDLIDKRVGSWHNDYLQVYMESGLAGLLSLLWIIAAIGFLAYRMYRRRSVPAEHRPLAGGLVLSAAILFLVGGFLDTHVSLLFRFMLALLALLGGIAPSPAAKATPGPTV